ncbi:MAG: hypothetical protein ACU0CI_12250 [Shimia sp.]
MTGHSKFLRSGEKRALPMDWIVLTLGLIAMGLSAATIAASGTDGGAPLAEACASAECATR